MYGFVATTIAIVVTSSVAVAASSTVGIGLGLVAHDAGVDKSTQVYEFTSAMEVLLVLH